MSTSLLTLHRRRPPWPTGQRRLTQVTVALLLVLIGIGFTWPRPVYAAAVTVDGTTCTLVEGITSANNDSAAGNGCVDGSGADTITLQADVLLTTAADVNFFNGNTGLPLISSVITIEGEGHTIARSTASGTPAFRLFFVSESGNLTLNRVTLTGGNAGSTGGGALYNWGTTTVNNSTLSGNKTIVQGPSSANGGAIFNVGTMTVRNSTITDNSAGTNGGGIYVAAGKTLTLNRSLISGNTALSGAEIAGAQATPLATINVNNANLFGYSSNAGIVGFSPGATDIVPTQPLAQILDPTLTNNGGFLTHALVTGSPALDAAGDSGLGTDQRGVTRPQGSADDIGAFELQVASATPGAALDFDGADDYVTLPALNLNSNTITFEGWIYPQGAQNAWTGLMVVRDNNHNLGLLLRENNELGYLWDNAYWDFSSGLTVPSDQWSHVALVVEPTKATLYLNGTAATNTASHVSKAFDVGLELGRDKVVPSRIFKGQMDEVRIWNRALAASELAADQNCELGSSPGGLVARYNFNQGVAAADNSSETTLADGSPNAINGALMNFALSGSSSNWVTPGSTASGVPCTDRPALDVLGNGVSIASGDTTPNSADNTDFGLVASNATASKAFTLRNTGTANLTVSAISFTGDQAGEYSLVTPPSLPLTIAPGAAQTITVQLQPTATSIRRATLTIASNDPTTPSYTIALQGGTPPAGAALDFDGIDDYVTLPALNLNSNTVTFEAWIKPAGIQNEWTGLLEVRGNNHHLGLLLRSNNELGYQWDGAYWDFSSGLTVPSDQWSHVALVVEPTKAILYLNGTAATNTGSHGVKAFDAALELGRDSLSASAFFKGQMDEVRIWNRALTASELAADQNCELGSTPGGLVARYNFNQGTAGAENSSATTLADGTPNANNGALMNFALSGSSSNWVTPGSTASGIPCIDRPEIDLQGNGVTIASGDTTPVSTDHTDFGKVLVNSGTAVRTFTIRNVGTGGLTLSGTPLVTVSGTHASDFIVTQPAVSTLAANSSTTFQITFDPSVAGVVTATVSLANNDSDENPYTFVVGATGTVPNVQFQGVACDLIDAITAANTNTATGACPAGSGVVTDTITLLSDVSLTEADNNGVETGPTGLPVISSPIIIEGASHTISRAAGAPVFRFFIVTNEGTLILNAVTLHNYGPNGGPAGGAIRNNGGTVRVSNSTFSSNTANGEGGAIANHGGTLTLHNSTLSDSHALYDGGAIYNSGTVAVYNSILSDNHTTDGGGGALANEGTATVQNSTLSGNGAPNIGGGILNGNLLTVQNSTLIDNSVNGGGGAIYNLHTATVSNSTFSGNSANIGGGIYNNRILTVQNSTISGNSATESGGGIYNDSNPSTVTLARSLLSGNTASEGAEFYNDPGYAPYGIEPGTVNSNNTNLFGHDGNAGTSGFTPGAADLVPNGALATILGVLADNGGDTATHALVAGSPAIDAAGDSGLDTDQRGVTRPQGAADDIGAFELAAAAAPGLEVQGNGVGIANGATPPIAANQTDFGKGAVGGGALVRTFTIRNVGTAALSLSGNPQVTVSGSSAFSVSSQPASNNLAVGASTTFQITFAPSAVGVFTTTVSIANNSAKNPYTFVVGGTGILPNAQLNGVSCDLIDAINAANSNAAAGSCPAGSSVVTDTITLLRDVELDAVNTSGSGGATGLPWIVSPITIEGSGYTIRRATTAPDFYIFFVLSNGALTLNRLTLSNGHGILGGAIYNAGTLTVSNSTLSGNSANNSGGAIYNAGTLTVSNSALSGNATNNSGGAIYNYGMLTVSNSTFSGNSTTYDGGAIYNYGTLTMSNSTLSGNAATAGSGGAIINYSTLTLNRNLIAGNSAASDGREIYNGVNNSVINANNYNLIGYSDNAGTTNFTPGATDIVPSQALAQILDTTLKVNGSGPDTHALVTGSPALDVAGDSGLATDQRGVTRPQGAADDIGAFELEVVIAAPEIDVQGNSVSIASGDTTPSTTDGTDFGSMDASSGTVVRTFTIQNTGTAALTLSGSPRVVVSGAHASDFTVTTQPASGSVAAAGSTTFVITFDPSAVGVRKATVTLANNDSDEGSYSFAIQGAGASKVTSQITQLSFGKVSSSTTPDSTYPAQSTVGVMVARLSLKNSGNTINNLYFRVITLNNNNWLLSADGAPGQVGSRVTVANSALPGGNNLWELNESFSQDFRIGVMVAATIQFKVDVYAATGVTAAGADGEGDELLGSYYIELDPTAPDGAHVIYLPVITQ